MLTGNFGRIPAPAPAKLRVDNLHYDLTEDDLYVSRLSAGFLLWSLQLIMVCLGSIHANWTGHDC